MYFLGTIFDGVHLISIRKRPEGPALSEGSKILKRVDALRGHALSEKTSFLTFSNYVSKVCKIELYFKHVKNLHPDLRKEN